MTDIYKLDNQFIQQSRERSNLDKGLCILKLEKLKALKI